MKSNLKYFNHIKSDFEKTANNRSYSANTVISIDWGELQFLLSVITDEYETLYMNNRSSITDDKYVDSDEEIRRNQSEMLLAYWLFVRENNLEEQFEYFMLDKANAGQIN